MAITRLRNSGASFSENEKLKVFEKNTSRLWKKFIVFRKSTVSCDLAAEGERKRRCHAQSELPE